MANEDRTCGEVRVLTDSGCAEHAGPLGSHWLYSECDELPLEGFQQSNDLIALTYWKGHFGCCVSKSLCGDKNGSRDRRLPSNLGEW